MTASTTIIGTLQKLLGQDFNLSLFVSIVKRTLTWIGLLIVMCGTIVGLYLRYTLPVFETSSTLMLKTEKTQQILGVNQLLADSRDEIYREIELLKSKMMMERALKHLDLSVSYFKAGKTQLVSSDLYPLPPFKVTIRNIDDPAILDKDINFTLLDDKMFELRYLVDEAETYRKFKLNEYFEFEHAQIKIELDSSQLSNIAAHIEQQYFFRINEKSAQAQRLASKVFIDPLNVQTNTVIIQMRGTNKYLIRDVVNAIAKEYIIYDVERKTASANQILSFLAFQIDTFGKDLARFQDTLKLFRLEHEYLSPENELASVMSNLTRLKGERVQIELDNSQLVWLHDYIENQKNLSQVATNLIDPGLSNYSRYIATIKDYTAARRELLLGVTTEHPTVGLLDEKMDLVKSDMFTNLNSAQRNLRRRSTYVEQQFADNLVKLLELPEIEAEYNRLIRKYNIKESFYLKLLDQQANYKIAEAGIVSDYLILKRANSPSTPVFPNELLLWSIAITAALIIGLIIVAIRYMMHNTIIAVDEIARISKAAILGVIPTAKTDSETSQVVVDKNPKSVISESFRSVRSNLQFMSSEKGAKTAAVTSTMPGEGKTFIAINLAAVLSYLDKKVVVCDLDMRKPRINKVFDVDNSKGMSTMLINKDTVDDCIQKSDIENMDFITSGPIPPNPSELIITSNLGEIVKELKQRYDYIIFDTPPIGLVTDALEIMHKVTYPIYTFRADYSDKAFIGNTNRLMRENKIHNLSVVLNDVGRGVSGYYYGAGDYGYGYGYVYGSGYRYGYGYGSSYGYYFEEDIEKPGILKRLMNRFTNSNGNGKYEEEDD